MYLYLKFSADWNEYERFLEVREESRYPRIWFNENELNLSGMIEDWNDLVINHIEGFLDKGRLIVAVKIDEQKDEPEVIITLDELKAYLKSALER